TQDSLAPGAALLRGGETFAGFAAAWPSMEETEGDFAVRMNTLPKYIASHTLTEPWPGNGAIIKGDVAEAVANLKEQPGGQILIYGSARLVNTLLARDRIQRYKPLGVPR